jgi:hypothetical protein
MSKNGSRIDIGNGALTDVGLSIMQLGMITGLHAAISPSFFTFACFAKKPEECSIARRTLWISWIATTIVNLGVLFAFKRLAPAVTGQIVGTGLFLGGMMAVNSKDAPSEPSMTPKKSEEYVSPSPPLPAPSGQEGEMRGFSRINGLSRIDIAYQPEILRAGKEWHHYLDAEERDSIVTAGATEGDE